MRSTCSKALVTFNLPFHYALLAGITNFVNFGMQCTFICDGDLQFSHRTVLNMHCWPGQRPLSRGLNSLRGPFLACPMFTVLRSSYNSLEHKYLLSFHCSLDLLSRLLLKLYECIAFAKPLDRWKQRKAIVRSITCFLSVHISRLLVTLDSNVYWPGFT